MIIICIKKLWTVKTTLRKSDTFIFQIEFFSKLSHYRQTHHPITTAVRNGRLVSPATTTSTIVADNLFTCISQHPEQFHKQDQIMWKVTYDKVSPISRTPRCWTPLPRWGTELCHHHPKMHLEQDVFQLFCDARLSVSGPKTSVSCHFPVFPMQICVTAAVKSLDPNILNFGVVHSFCMFIKVFSCDRWRMKKWMNKFFSGPPSGSFPD